ncbi:glycine--tRNA ligase subunit beta [Pseudomarimonas salicorniae]|uniref:Glycine--tRNA ligase beta subunit n=1 Tax=Pseudomarimonas salicorniae TaxID=2933270 RepID=A0ABT0GGI3_9GAMM|nr:glycine--tRNA ligase subunit beta [Lysobacter sp. CAU 1642]MCK7593645.1 glycine--tRNA ligase subunit beta [Lysobacter sp. CAU 1642]
MSPLSLEPQAHEQAQPGAKREKESLFNKPLLIELGTEELPVKALPGLARALADGIVAGLDKREVMHGPAKLLYTPRRLAVMIDAVAPTQPEQRSERRGPAIAQAFDAKGEPSKAVLGFAASCGVTVDKLERLHTDKGAWFVHRSVSPGAPLHELVPEIIAEAVRGMPIPKPMRWGAHEHAFARPVHWLLVLHGERVIDTELLGVKADRMTRGHRFYSDKALWVAAAGDYLDTLRGAKVIADPDERRDRIRAEISRVAGVSKQRPRIDAGILEEVNCLTEWPCAVLCSFEERFLRVPQEALILTMESNQKFFPLLKGDGGLAEQFIGIANIDSKDVAEVRKGYERVIRPRFADAEFFYNEDVKQGLATMNEGLAQVTYQQKLGSYADKVQRVGMLVDPLARAAGVDPELARHAAQLSKADLQSRMVGEFPELQGVMGRYYAVAAGLPPELANAIDQQYQPRFAGDAIAASPMGRVLAAAERIDTLAGGFAAGLKPSGNKDPFALRRAALGLARTLIEGKLEIGLSPLFARANSLLPGTAKPVEVDELMDFVYDRLRGYLQDQGVPGSHFEAVLAVRPVSLSDFSRRIEAIGSFTKLSDAEALAAANKRIRNILRKAEGEVAAEVQASALKEEAERALLQALEQAEEDTRGPLAEHDYVAVLRRLARLRPQVDAFFDAVMVMVDDQALRSQRLGLLQRLSDRFLAVADISGLAHG